MSGSASIAIETNQEGLREFVIPQTEFQTKHRGRVERNGSINGAKLMVLLLRAKVQSLVWRIENFCNGKRMWHGSRLSPFWERRGGAVVARSTLPVQWGIRERGRSIGMKTVHIYFSSILCYHNK